MLKKGYVIFLILGVVLLCSGGVFLFLNKESEEEIFSINTENFVGDEIDNSKYAEYEVNEYKDFQFKSFNTSINNVYNMNYPSDLEYLSFHDFSIFFNDEISIKISFIDEKIDDYKSSIQKKYEVPYFDKMNLSSFSNQKNIRFNGYDVDYFKICSFNESKIDKEELYVEHFVFLIKESQDSFISIELIVNSKRLTDNFLNKFFNNIKIEKNNAKYLYTSTSDGMIFGELVNDNDYKIAYVFDAERYKEIESYRNNDSSHTFSVIKNNDVFINISLKSISDLEKLINDYENVAKFHYEKYGIAEEFYDGKMIHKVSLEKSNGSEVIYLIQVEDFSVYIISMFSNDLVDNFAFDFIPFDLSDKK